MPKKRIRQGSVFTKKGKVRPGRAKKLGISYPGSKTKKAKKSTNRPRYVTAKAQPTLGTVKYGTRKPKKTKKRTTRR